jgi:hypothetical protein
MRGNYLQCREKKYDFILWKNNLTGEEIIISQRKNNFSEKKITSLRENIENKKVLCNYRSLLNERKPCIDTVSFLKAVLWSQSQDNKIL